MKELTKGRPRCVYVRMSALVMALLFCWSMGVGCVSKCKQVRAEDDYEDDWYVAEVTPCQHVKAHQRSSPKARATKPKPVRWELWLFPKLPR